MKPTERLRKQIGILLRLGVNQKELATRMAVSETTFSRWYRNVPDSKGRPAKIPAEALDLFEEYVREFLLLAQAEESQRSAASVPETLPAIATGTAGGLQRSNAPAGSGPVGKRRRPPEH